MTANPLKTEMVPKRSPHEWAAFFNETKRDAVNADRRKEGLDPITWVVRNGVVKVELVHQPVRALAR